MYRKIPKLTVIGAGPGDVDLITVKAVNVLKTAEVVLYDALVNEELLSYVNPNAELIFVGKRKGCYHYQQEQINELIVTHAHTHGHVVRLKGGDPFFEQAQRIVNLSQQSGVIGWKQNDGNKNRFWLIDTMRSNTFREYRETLYSYHRKGLDLMTETPEEAKNGIITSILSLENLFTSFSYC